MAVHLKCMFFTDLLIYLIISCVPKMLHYFKIVACSATAASFITNMCEIDTSTFVETCNHGGKTG